MNNKSKVPNIVRGGRAIPLRKNLFLLKGRSHEQGGIDIGANPRTGIEAQGGEIVQIKPNEIRVISKEKMFGGVRPAQAVLNGANPDKVFNAQERYKDRLGLNDDGTYAELGTKNKLVNGLINMAMADSPAVMTASGWRRKKNGEYVQDKQNDKGVEQLRNNLAEISLMSPTNPATALIDKGVKVGSGLIAKSVKPYLDTAIDRYFFKQTPDSFTRGIGDKIGLDDLKNSGKIRGSKGTEVTAKEYSKSLTKRKSDAAIWKELNSKYPDISNNWYRRNLTEDEFNAIRNKFNVTEKLDVADNEVMLRRRKPLEEYKDYKEYIDNVKNNEGYGVTYDNNWKEDPMAYFYEDGRNPLTKGYGYAKSDYGVKINNASSYNPYIHINHEHYTTKGPVSLSDPNVNVYGKGPLNTTVRLNKETFEPQYLTDVKKLFNIKRMGGKINYKTYAELGTKKAPRGTLKQLPYKETIEDIYNFENPERKGIKNGVAKKYDDHTVGAGIDFVKGHPEYAVRARTTGIPVQELNDASIKHLRHDDKVIMDQYAKKYGRAAADTVSYGPRFLAAQHRYMKGNIIPIVPKVINAMAKGDGEALRNIILETTPTDHKDRIEEINNYDIYPSQRKKKATGGRIFSINGNVKNGLLMTDRKKFTGGGKEKINDEKAPRESKWYEYLIGRIHDDPIDDNQIIKFGSDNYSIKQLKDIGYNIKYDNDGKLKVFYTSKVPKKYDVTDTYYFNKYVNSKNLTSDNIQTATKLGEKIGRNFNRERSDYLDEQNKQYNPNGFNPNNFDSEYFMNPSKVIAKQLKNNGLQIKETLVANNDNDKIIKNTKYNEEGAKFLSERKTGSETSPVEDMESENTTVVNTDNKGNGSKSAGSGSSSQSSTGVQTRTEQGKGAGVNPTAKTITDSRVHSTWRDTIGDDADVLNFIANGDVWEHKRMQDAHSKIMRETNYNPENKRAVYHPEVRAYYRNFNNKFNQANKKLEAYTTPAGKTGDNQFGERRKAEYGTSNPFEDDYMGNQGYYRHFGKFSLPNINYLQSETDKRRIAPERRAFFERPDGYIGAIDELARKKPEPISVDELNKDLQFKINSPNHQAAIDHADKIKTETPHKFNPNWLDGIGLIGNLAGSLTSGLITNKMLKDAPQIDKIGEPVHVIPGRLKTTYNINPQLTQIEDDTRRMFGEIDRNTVSSNVGLARKQASMLAGQRGKNELYGKKENIETDLYNKDVLNRQAIRVKNAEFKNEYNRNDLTRRLYNLKYDYENKLNRISNMNNMIGGINSGIQDLLARIESRRALERTLGAIKARNPNAPIHI